MEPQNREEFGEPFLRFLGIPFMKPSGDEIYASDGARYRKDGHLTAFGVFLFFWDKLIERWNRPLSELSWIERLVFGLVDKLPPA